MEPADNVELRADRHGHLHVVFAFPYRADIVDAVRAIPGRRFDWDAKEWWAPQADDTAPFVKGVIERHPALRVADDVRAWLARGRGRLGRPRVRDPAGGPRGVRAGDDLRRRARGARRGGARRAPLGPVLAGRGRRPARAARRAARQARAALRDEAPGRPRSRPARRSPWSRASASRASRSTSTGTRTRSPPSSPCPACEAHGRSLPLDPYLVEPLEHYLRTYAVDVAPNAADALERLRVEHDGAIEGVRRSRAHDAPPLAVEAVLGGELKPFQRAGVAYALDARRTFLADEQGLGKTVQALAALEADDAYPAIVICPASLKLNWERETRHWLPHRSLDRGVRHRDGRARPPRSR